jgi:hypothetical protein
MAASHRSRGERAPGVGSLRGLAYNRAGATWILTSDFAENGADSKRACDSGASSSRFTAVGRLLQWPAHIGKGQNGVAGVSRSSSRAQWSLGRRGAAWQR